MSTSHDRPEWDWIDSIQVGDVLLDGGKSERVVRDLGFGKNGRVRYVLFSIKVCSWTRRCYTVLTRNDLKTRRFKPSGVRVELSSKMDEEILRNMKDKNCRSLKCCDVKGIK